MIANHPFRQWRVGHALSVDQVASLIDTSASAVRNYELGRRVPHPAVMARIEMVTRRGVTASDFLPDVLPTRATITGAPPEPSSSAGMDGEGSAAAALPEHVNERENFILSQPT